MAASYRYRRDAHYGRDDHGVTVRATDEVRSSLLDAGARGRQGGERDIHHGGMYRGSQRRTSEARGSAWPGVRPGGGAAAGWMAGKSPSECMRPDDRIREDVCDSLTDDPGVQATNIEVAVQGGEVTLNGIVDRRDDRRRAEDIAERIIGVRDVTNRLRVGMAVASGLGSVVPTTTRY